MENHPSHIIDKKTQWITFTGSPWLTTGFLSFKDTTDFPKATYDPIESSNGCSPTF